MLMLIMIMILHHSNLDWWQVPMAYAENMRHKFSKILHILPQKTPYYIF